MCLSPTLSLHTYIQAHAHRYSVVMALMYRSLAGMAFILTLAWAIPSPPTDLTLTAGSSFGTSTPVAEMVLMWTPPGTNAVSYRVYCDNRLVQTTRKTTSIITNLVVGTTYNFAVAAVDSTGESTRVAASATAQVRPSAPMNVQLVPGDGTIDVFWVSGDWNRLAWEARRAGGQTQSLVPSSIQC